MGKDGEIGLFWVGVRVGEDWRIEDRVGLLDWFGLVWSGLLSRGEEMVGTGTETGTETKIETGIGAWWDDETYFIACGVAGWLDLTMQVSWLLSWLGRRSSDQKPKMR